MSLLTVASLGTATLFGCSSSSTSGPAAEPSPAAAEPLPPCDDGTYRIANGSCVPYPSFDVARSSVLLTPVRDHHTTTVVETASGPWLYVVGGTDGWDTLHADVQRARIKADGSLGAFEVAGSLPAARAGHCMVQVKNTLYLFGGIVGATAAPTATTVAIVLDAEGKVARTEAGPDMPLPVMHVSCNLVGEHVLVLGGRGKNSRSTKLSARAHIDPATGKVGAFEATTPLAPDRSHHASFIHDKRLYVVGGLSGNPAGQFEAHKDVMMTDVADDGTLGEWIPGGALPVGISVSSAQLYENAVYVFGGLEGDGSVFSDKIRRATFNDDGTLSAFATLDKRLPDGRGHVHQTPVFGRFIYSVAGQDNDYKSTGNVDIGRFD